jgi:mono/diheme cytochrome c family protein
MNRILTIATLFSALLCCTSVFAQDQGETLFNQTCVACHTIGQGKLIGPDLANIHSKREESWIIQFVQSSQSMIADGDVDAVALFEEYNQMPMPDHPLSGDDVRAILGYIALRSPAGDAPIAETAPEVVPPVNVTAEAVAMGRDLFVGTSRFENGATACNSCHHVNTDAVMTGGALAKDLTSAYSRLTGNGIQAMMASPPFPMMRTAFEGKSLTDEEMSFLVAFLRSVDEKQATQEVRNYGNTLLSAGLIGVVILLGFFSLIGIRSTKRTVNHKIYDRQIKST